MTIHNDNDNGNRNLVTGVVEAASMMIMTITTMIMTMNLVTGVADNDNSQ